VDWSSGEEEGGDGMPYMGVFPVNMNQATLLVSVKEATLLELRVPELKQVCSHYGLSNKGLKQDMIKRLQPVLEAKHKQESKNQAGSEEDEQQLIC